MKKVSIMLGDKKVGEAETKGSGHMDMSTAAIVLALIALLLNVLTWVR